MKIAYLLIALLALVSASPGQALERPASFDPAGRITEWTRKLESDAGLFPELTGFQRARLWQGDSSFVIEIDTEQGRLRRGITPQGLDSLRERVALYLSGQGRRYALNQDGRGAYLLWQIPLSLGWYGPAVVAIIQPSSGVTSTGLYLTSAASSYSLPFMITRNRQVTPGQEHMSIAGGIRGIAAGGAIAILTGSDDASVNSSIMLTTSIAGQIAGYNWGKSFTKPQGRIISHYATFGMNDVPLLLAAITFDEDKDPAVDDKLMAAGSLIGLAGGTVLGHSLAAGRDISEGTPSIIANSGWAGMAAGCGLYFSLQPQKEIGGVGIHARTLMMSGLAGNVAGLYLGHRLVRGYSFSRSEGYLAIGTTAGGALLGAGIGFLVSPTEGAYHEGNMLRTITGLSTLGLAGGYALGMMTVRKQYNRTQGPAGLRLELNPLGPAMLAAKRQAAVPWVTARF